MPQVLKGIKTFFIFMTQPDDLNGMTDENDSIEATVKEIESQESGRRTELEEELEGVKFPRNNGVVTREDINESEAQNVADGKKARKDIEKQQIRE